MARSYVETAFRHPLLMLAPIIAGFLAGAAFAYVQPREYVATASVWADTSVPDPTTIGTTGGTTPPSAGQAALLTQMLGTRAFLESVAMNSPVAEDLRDLGRLDMDYALADLGSRVTVSTPGPQILTVAVESLAPEDATGVAAAVIEQFEAFKRMRLQQRAQSQVDYDTERLEDARQALADAQEAAQAYLGQNRSVDVTADATASTLLAAVSTARQAYEDAASSFSVSSLALADAEAASVEVLDPPEVAYPQARMKVLIIGAGGGLAAGLTVSVLLLLLLMARDDTLRGDADVEKVLGLPVSATVPEFTMPVAGRHSRTAQAASSAS